MENATHWFLINILSPLLLPIFVIGLLCMIAGVRPEPIVAGCLNLFADVLRYGLSLVQMLLAALLKQKAVPPSRRRPFR
jgi:hypothetical protein